MKYILSASTKAFIVIKDNEIIVTPDYSKASQYDKIGEAMKVASLVNDILECSCVKLLPID